MIQLLRQFVLLSALAALLLFGCSHSKNSHGEQTLNTGKDIGDLPANTTSLGGFPVGLVPSLDNHFAIVCGMGYRQSLYSIATSDGHLAGEIKYVSKAPVVVDLESATDNISDADRGLKTNGIYYGVAVAGNKIYAAQGAHDSISVLSLASNGDLHVVDSIPTKAHDFPAGLAMDRRGHLYVSNNSSADLDNRFIAPASLAIYDAEKKLEVGRYVFDSPTHTSNYPLAIAALADGSKAYCASERDGCVYVLNVSNHARPTLLATLATGARPAAILLNHNQTRLFVANSLSDTLSVIDTATDQVVGTVLLRPGSVRGLPGVTPTAMAFSPDEKELYVTLSNMNAVGLVDVLSLALEGMIPVGNYPTGVLATADHRLLVVNARGTQPRNPNPLNNPLNKKVGKNFLVLNVMQGNLIALPIPNRNKLAELTEIVMQNNHLNEATPQPTNTLAAIGLKASNIKHVIYVIKENRTYDQVMGDNPRGNGDPSLVIFGKSITPNQHALADRFVLLDNFFSCGDVSGDGWTWSTQGMASAYVNRNVPYNLSRRGRTYDFEGENNGYITAGFPATDPDGNLNSQNPLFKNGAPPIPDVASTDLHIWDLARQAGLTYRNYGMFLSIKNGNEGVASMPNFYPTVAGLQPPGHDLAGKTDIDFIGFNLDYPDSDAPAQFFEHTQDKRFQYKLNGYGKFNAPSRFAEWNREFQQMLKLDPSGDQVPAMMLIRLPHDHTQGLASNKHSPAAEVADNDYAVGQLVDAISHSAIWKSSAILIVEDDAQNGPDHVDAHRTTAFIASPWIKAGSIDHAFHNTDSMLKTIELLLGLPAMTQYDAIAKPIEDWADMPINSVPFDAILPSAGIIGQVNPAARLNAAKSNSLNDLIAASDAMDFSHADAAPAELLNESIWKSVKGSSSPMPTPRNSIQSAIRGAVAQPVRDKDDD